MNTLRLITTNQCNAYELKRISESPGVCRFCYRSTEKINATQNAVDMIFDRIKENGAVDELVVTGGDPLVSPFLSQILENSNKINLNVTLHTNGILLEKNGQRLGGGLEQLPCHLTALNQLFKITIEGMGSMT